MDHRHGLFEDDLSLEECLERVQVLFYDESTNSESLMNLNYLDELLSKLHQQSPQSTTATRRVASFVRDVATFHPNACHLLLIHLPHLLDPIPFIEIIPSMFCIASPSLVVEAATQLKSLPERDSRLLLPVLCAMADLHLTGSLLDELYSLAEEAIGTLEEAELPALFRAILKSLCPLRAERAMLRLRDEMLNISESSVALLVEVMWEVLPSSSDAAEVFLNQIILDQESQSLRQPPLTDLAIVLILTSNIGALKNRARVLLEAWLKQGTFPFSQLELVLSLRRSNEIWERMIPAVWRLCLWTLESLTDYESRASASSSSARGSAGAGGGGRGRVYLTNKEGLSRTVLRLCECLPSMRETVVSNLLGRCYAEGAISSACSSSGSGSSSGNAVNDSVGQDRDGAWLMNYHPLGYASAEYGIESVGLAGSGSLNIISQGFAVCTENGADRRRWNVGTKIRASVVCKAQSEALLASTVLESLVGEHPEIGASVLSSIMDRLTPSSPSQGGLLALPPAAILHSLAGCIIKGTCSSPQIENTVFIVIQKLLASAQLSPGVEAGNYTLLNILRHPSMSGSLRPQTMKGGTADSGMHSLQIKHSPGTVGCYLSGHLLLRNEPNSLSNTDFGAVLTWLTRAFKHFSDIAIACALDILVACLLRIRIQDPRFTNEDAARVSLLVAAADTCLQWVLKLKALVLCEDEYKAGERDDTFVVDVDLHHHFSTHTGHGKGPSSDCTLRAVRWNVTALSANLISTEMSSDRVKGSERVGGQERTGDIAMVASSTFWVLQRASALHCCTHTLDSASDKGDHRTPRPSVGIILSKSELDIPEKAPWMSESAVAALARRCVATGTDTGGAPTAVAVAAAVPRTKGVRATRSASCRAESDALKSSISPGLCVWACSAADGIEGLTFTRSLSLSASEVLSLAWERALCSAVLLGYFPVGSYLSDSTHPEVEALMRVSRLLCQTHMGRLMLRGTLAGSSNQGGQGSKSEMGTREARLRTGKGSRFSSHLVGDAGSYESKAEYQRALREAQAAAECRVDSLTIQKNVLHGLLSRVESLMDSQSLLLALTALLHPMSTGDAVGVTTTTHSEGRVSAASPPVLLTDAGLAVVCCFACRLLNGQLEVSIIATDTASQDSSTSDASHSSVIRRPEEVFYTLQEVVTPPRTAAQLSSGSSSSASFSASSSSGASNTHSATPTPGPSIPDLSALLCSLLSLVPRLCHEEEALRRASAVSTSYLSTSWHPGSASTGIRNNSSTTSAASNRSLPADQSPHCGDSSDPFEKLHGMMGAPLDRAGCAVLILVLYALLDQGVHLARRRATGDLMEIAADPFISAAAKALAKSAIDLTPVTSSDAVVCHLSDSSSDRCCMLSLYDVFERQALDTQDVTLAVGGLHLLSSLSEGTLLARRQASVAWTLLHTLHTQHASLSTHLLVQGLGQGQGLGNTKENDSEKIPGTDDIWPHLASYVCPALSPSLDCALVELQHGGSAGFFVASGSKAMKSAVSAFRLAVGMSAATSRNVDLSFLAHSISSFRTIWTAWWSAEAPEGRVNGVVALLLEIFRCHLLPPDTVSTTGTTAKYGAIEKGKSSSKAPKTGSTSTGGANARARVSHATSTSQDSFSFPALCSDTLDALFALAVGMFPALFLLAQPRSSLELLEGNGEREAGPYGSFVAVTKAFVWVLQQLEDVLEDGSQLHFTMRTSCLCVRITRAVLVCVEGAIVGVAAWRSSQVLPRSSRSASSSGRSTSDSARRSSPGHSDSDNSDDDSSSIGDSAPAGDPGSDPVEEDAEEDADLGSVEYLACMLDWSQVLAHRAIRYAEALKGRMLHPDSGLQVPRELSRATPQLQFTAERLAARILRTAKAHSVQLKDPEEMFAMCVERCRKNRDSLADDEATSRGGGRVSKKRQLQGQEDRPLKWDEGIKVQAEGFNRAHRQALLKPPSDSLWCSIGVADPRSASRAASDQGGDLNADEREDVDAAGAEEGISSAHDTSEEEENDEDDDEEEEEGHNGFVARYRKGRTSGGWGQRRYLDEEDEGEDEGVGSEADGLLAPVLDLPFPVRQRAPMSVDPAPIERSPIVVLPVVTQIDPVSSSKRGRTAGKGDSMAALTRPASASISLDAL